MKEKFRDMRARVKYMANWRKVWRWISFVLLIASIVGGIGYASYSSYHNGYDHGQREGQCQLGCAFLGMDYAFYDAELDCWCQAGPNSYYAVPVQKSF